jgi:hypothetical protein
MSDAWVTLGSVVVGGVLSTVGGAFGAWFNWQRERQSMAAALAGEIEALIDVINWREAREGILRGSSISNC